MKIKFHKNFEKKFKKLSPLLKKRVISAMSVFLENPLDPSLKNHPLKGGLKGKRSFSVTGDVRVIFEEYDGYVLVIMLDVGTHNQVY